MRHSTVASVVGAVVAALLLPSGQASAATGLRDLAAAKGV